MKQIIFEIIKKKGGGWLYVCKTRVPWASSTPCFLASLFFQTRIWFALACWNIEGRVLPSGEKMSSIAIGISNGWSGRKYQSSK